MQSDFASCSSTCCKMEFETVRLGRSMMSSDWIMPLLGSTQIHSFSIQLITDGCSGDENVLDLLSFVSAS